MSEKIMPTAERYAKMTEEQKEIERQRGREYYQKDKGQAQRRFYQKHKKEILEIAHFVYLDNPQKEIDRNMKYYRQKHPVVQLIRERKKGEQWPPKVCPNCGKTFVPHPQHKNQIYCSSYCAAKKVGYLNLPQYKSPTNCEKEKAEKL
jgi:hypothetical protein